MKKPKDPESPTRNKSAFMFYCATTRPDLEQEHSTYDAKILRKSWLKLSPSERKPFIELAQKDKDRYYKERDIQHGFLQEESDTTNEKKLWNPKKPKRNKPAFMFFCEDKRSEVKSAFPKFTVHQTTKKLSDMWTSLTKDQRKVYEDIAEKDLRRYQFEKDVFEGKQQEEETISESDSSQVSEDEKPIHLCTKRKEVTGPNTAFQYYAQAKRGEVIGVYPYFKQQQINKILLERWSKLAEGSKELYEALAEYDLKHYHQPKKKRKRELETG